MPHHGLKRKSLQVITAFRASFEGAFSLLTLIIITTPLRFVNSLKPARIMDFDGILTDPEIAPAILPLRCPKSPSQPTGSPSLVPSPVLKLAPVSKLATSQPRGNRRERVRQGAQICSWCR